MAGINTLLDIGRKGLFASQTNIGVTGNNIANIDTKGYRRQSVVLEESSVLNTSSGQLGTGVDATEVIRHFDRFIEEQYNTKSSQQEKWNALNENLQNVESLFNESSGAGINSSLSEFFSNWQTLSSRPDNSAARIALLGQAESLLGSLNTAGLDMEEQSIYIDEMISENVEEANKLVSSIADLNRQIQIQDVAGSSNANALYDERDKLVRELAEKVDINYIDNGGGNVSILTKSGQTLVDGVNHYEFKFEGPQVIKNLTPSSNFSGTIEFQGSSNHEYLVDITSAGDVGTAQYRVSIDGGQTWLKDNNGNTIFTTSDTSNYLQLPGEELKIAFDGTGSLSVGDQFDIVAKKGLYWYENAATKENITPTVYSDNVVDDQRLSSGSLAGQLMYRDSYLGDYQEKLNSLAKSLIWEVNKLHSQGTGLTAFTSSTSGYAVGDDSAALDSTAADLDFGNKITNGSFEVYVYNSSGNVAKSEVEIDLSSAADDGLDDIATKLNAIGLSASIVDGKLQIESSGSSSFAFGEDSSGVLAALGLNTFFDGSDAESISINSNIINDSSYINTGHVNGAGEFNTGDNTTSLSVADLQYTKVEIETSSGASTQTLQDYYDFLVGKVGADTATAEFNYTYEKTLADELNARQEEVSGVNLDEEMSNLIKFQQSYTASAKLISTADSMFQTLLSLKN